MNWVFKIVCVLLLGICIPTNTHGQFTLLESEEEKEKKAERKYLEFQEHFFEALQQRSREDYNKAIESLDNCKVIYPENAAMFFEYAKNYLKLKDYENAIFFSEKALEKKPDNIFILEHIKNTYSAQYDFKNAIEIQHKLVALKPSKENDLIYLYIRNKEKEKAKASYFKLEKLSLLDERKAYFERVLFPKKSKFKKKPIEKKETVNAENKENTLEGLRKEFEKNKSFRSLLKLLQKEEENKQYELIVKDSNKGLSLFPAQPVLYLINSKAQNQLKQHKQALQNLQIGLDFIIDNNEMLVAYYEQMKIAYLGLGQNANATKYQNKALALRKTN